MCVCVPGTELRPRSSARGSRGSSHSPGHLGESRQLRLILAAGRRKGTSASHTHFKDRYNPTTSTFACASFPHFFFWDSLHIIPGVKVIFPPKWIYLMWALEPRLCNKPWNLCCLSCCWCWSTPSGGLWVRPVASVWHRRSIYLQTAHGTLACNPAAERRRQLKSDSVHRSLKAGSWIAALLPFPIRSELIPDLPMIPRESWSVMKSLMHSWVSSRAKSSNPRWITCNKRHRCASSFFVFNPRGG